MRSGTNIMHRLRKPPKVYSLEKKKARLGFIFLLPSILVICSIILYPLISTLIMGFFRNNLMNPSASIRFIGFENFLYLLKNETFWKALYNNIILTVSSVSIQLVLGMIMALLLNMSFRGRSVVRGVTILPWATPTFVAAFSWIWLLDANYGMINILLKQMNILKEGYPWLGELNTVLISVVLAHVWKGLPWVVIVLLSGLQMVPSHLQESARVDGANPWQEFWNVVLPSIKSVIIIVILLRMIWTFNWFDYVFLLTGGGPLDATMTWPVQIYKIGFEAYEMGRSAALGGIMFVFLVIFTMVYFRVIKKGGGV